MSCSPWCRLAAFCIAALFPLSSNAVASFQGLGPLPGGDSAAAVAVSADGSTVVGFAQCGGACGGEAFRWTRGGGPS